MIEAEFSDGVVLDQVIVSKIQEEKDLNYLREVLKEYDLGLDTLFPPYASSEEKKGYVGLIKRRIAVLESV